MLRKFANSQLRIAFRDDDEFIVRRLTELGPGVREGSEQMWSGEVVATAGLSSHRARFFKPGSYVDFKASDVRTISDDGSSTVLYSRS